MNMCVYIYIYIYTYTQATYGALVGCRHADKWGRH